MQRLDPRRQELIAQPHHVHHIAHNDLRRSEGFMGDRNIVFHLTPICYWIKRLEAVVRAAGEPGPPAPLRHACML
jgi:hypothetical protein